MKKIFVLLFGLLATSQVFAQASANVCTAAAYTVTPNMFVVRSFPIRCSTNVVVATRENAIAFAVGAISIKGNNRFQGTTGGGAITGVPCADPKVCIVGDADNGLAALLALAT